MGQTRRCPHCGAPVEVGRWFCPHCEATLESQAAVVWKQVQRDDRASRRTFFLGVPSLLVMICSALVLLAAIAAGQIVWSPAPSATADVVGAVQVALDASQTVDALALAVARPSATRVALTPSTVPSPTRTPAPASTPGRTAAVVTRVVDGDTIEVSIDGLIYTVNYLSIDCPELDAASGPEAQMAQVAAHENQNLVGGKIVYLERDVSDADEQGRLLRYVFLADGTFVNAELVWRGVAQLQLSQPDVRYRSLFELAERGAAIDPSRLRLPATTPEPPGITDTPAATPTAPDTLTPTETSTPAAIPTATLTAAPTLPPTLEPTATPTSRAIPPGMTKTPEPIPTPSATKPVPP